MKINLPVTNDEVLLDDGAFLLSKTDLKGIITFANQDFIKTSGYSEAELVGQSHNIVRHPDMPSEAFEDLWHSLNVGQPWTGLVKNRTKSGDYYWVEANATAIIENGQVTGYLSARKKPSRQQVEAATTAYRLFKDGKAKGLQIIDGKVVKNTYWHKLKSMFTGLKVSNRLAALIGLAIVMSIGLVGMGIVALSEADNGMNSIYEDHMQASIQLSNLSKSMLHIEAQLFNVAGETTTIKKSDGKNSLILNKKVADEVVPLIEKDIATINALWTSYLATPMAADEKVLADIVVKAKDSFIIDGVSPTLPLIRQLNAEETMRYADAAPERYEVANNALQALINYQNTHASEEFVTSHAHYKMTRLVSFGALGVTILILMWFGSAITRSITRPLSKSISIFGKIASGDFGSDVDVQGNDEVSQVLRGLQGMQTTLNVNSNLQQELSNKVKEQSILFENQLAAINKSTGVIEFNMDGTVISANDIFLEALCYSLGEVIGQHHGSFMTEAYRNSPDYKAFWDKLNRGEAIVGEFERVGKSGQEVWLQASYNPILNATGKPYKVVKYATDITEHKLRNADFEGQVNAIGKTQGVIEIGLDGTVLKANETYLQMLGYSANELIGNHVSMVLDPTFAKSEAYVTLWNKLVQGGSDSGQYKRIAKGGREVWIQASYNPINDLHGKPFKIVNYTIDITTQKLQSANNAGQLAAIDKIQGVIEFDLTGKIIELNANFARAVGYSESDIVSKHHSMFVDAAYRSSHEYKAFWDNLAKGEAQAGQFKRIAKGGKEIWLQASYNPIMDINGKPFKVVEYATDITEQYKSAAALTEAVEETQAIIEAAKEGDLSSRVSLEGKVGAIASLCEGVNSLMSEMTGIIVQVREAGETINTAAGEIAAGNNDLSSRTEQQASSLEETAASMEQLASTVKNNAENAKQANQLSIAASGIAVKGGAVVSEVVATMSAINASSKKIEDIISVIDGIAFQTNILALNAAVEAARAGEQGRGFAVVAGEVRNLAQRSASAAKEIKELIHDSVSKTAEGTQQVETAGNTMHEIVSSVQRVTDIMAEITAASVEQSAGIDQVNQAVTSMDEVTQQNAALVEEAAAAESLVEQAASLIDTVSAFKLNGGNSRTTIRPTARLMTSKPALRATLSKPIAKLPTTRAIANSGGNNGDWEEF